MGADANTGPEVGSEAAKPGLSSAKREDIWALIIALVALLFSVLAPEAVHWFFDSFLYFM